MNGDEKRTTWLCMYSNLLCCVSHEYVRFLVIFVNSMANSWSITVWSNSGPFWEVKWTWRERASGWMNSTGQCREESHWCYDRQRHSHVVFDFAEFIKPAVWGLYQEDTGYLHLFASVQIDFCVYIQMILWYFKIAKGLLLCTLKIWWRSCKGTPACGPTSHSRCECVWASEREREGERESKIHNKVCQCQSSQMKWD